MKKLVHLKVVVEVEVDETDYSLIEEITQDCVTILSDMEELAAKKGFDIYDTSYEMEDA